MNETELINEANRRGYRTGTIVDYDGLTAGTDILGCGEFKVKGDRLIKYEKKLKDDNPSLRRFDTIFDKERGWTNIATKKQGFAL